VQSVARAGLQVAQILADFIETQALPGTGLTPEAFWQGTAEIFSRFAPRNKALLARRDDLQAQIDAWHEARAGKPIDQADYQAFLSDIGYLVPEPAPFRIASENVDPELAVLATLFEPDADGIRRRPDQAAQVLRGLTLAGTHPMLILDEPLPSDEIVSLVLDGIRARPDHDPAPA